MTGPPDDHKERSPDLQEQGEASGVDALPQRVNRYGQAKKRALDVAEYIEGVGDALLAGKVASCGEYLLFRHYFTIDRVRLHAASFCKQHLLCSLCAIRRGAKALGAYLPRYEDIRARRPSLRPFLVTLTVLNGPDLLERFQHLQRSCQELMKRRHRKGSGWRDRKRVSAVDGIEAAVWSYEVKRGSGSGLWHPHLHMVAMAESMPDARLLSSEWHGITGDSLIVDVRAIDEDEPASGFLEVFKYALKFSDMSPADTLEAFRALRGRRLVASAGLFRGIEIPEDLTDAKLLEELPYIELFYRWLGAGYSLQHIR